MKFVRLLCLVTAYAVQSPAQTAATGSISGTVRDAGAGTPVAQATVSVTLPDGKSVASSVDARGRYTLTEIPAGKYQINVEGAPEKGQLTALISKPVTLEAGQKLTSFDFRLPSLGIISGRVLDENREPVPNAQVFRIEKRYDHGALRYFAATGVFTDEAGVYRLTGVPSGEAFLVETQKKSIQTVSGGDAPANTFYPNVLSADLAAEIVLGPGETHNGVDIHRAKLPTYCVDGSVEAAVEPALDLKLLDMAVAAPRGVDPNTIGKTGADGTFRVCGLHRGEYLLLASGSSPDPSQMPFFAAATVIVTNTDLRDVKLPHNAMSTISAEFVWDGDESAQLPGLSGMLSLQSRSAGFNMAFKAPSSFSHVFPLQPDNYTIDVLRGINGPGQYMKEITCGGRSVLHGAAPLGGAISCGTLRFVIGHDGGSLTTRVADKDGNPISDAYVAIIPEWAATESEMSALMTIGRTGPDGVYSTIALAPGKYRVLATNETIDLFANRVDKLWAAQSRAPEVEIAANANVQLRLEPRPLQ